MALLFLRDSIFTQLYGLNLQRRRLFGDRIRIHREKAAKHHMNLSWVSTCLHLTHDLDNGRECKSWLDFPLISLLYRFFFR